MKIKCRPEDFVVEELPNVAVLPRGEFTLYRLDKTGIGTLEAISLIARRWGLPGGAIAFGGMKDTHARTTQLLTIARGPMRELREASFHLGHVGFLDRPYSPACFDRNRFTIVLRDLSAAERDRVIRELETFERDGIPNYFDDQRFGSVGADGEFIAGAWLKGDHERALWLALAAPYAFDKANERQEKAVLREYWGRWAEAKEILPRSHSRSLVTYLIDHPTDFRGAFARVRRELRSVYFAAFQSHLWNLLLARLIRRVAGPEQRIEVAFKLGKMPLPRALDADRAEILNRAALPLPASRGPCPEGELGEDVAEVLGEFGLTWHQLRVKHLKDVFFSKGSRPAMFRPREVRYRTAPDALYRGKTALTLEFELPRGAYATLVVKRLTET